MVKVVRNPSLTSVSIRVKAKVRPAATDLTNMPRLSSRFT